MEIEAQIKDFLASKLRNRWLGDSRIEVYIRKSVPRMLGGQLRTCLDIATIEVDEKHQRKGLAKSAISTLERLNPFESVFFENVLNPDLESALNRWGWIEDDRNPRCFYKLNPLRESSQPWLERQASRSPVEKLIARIELEIGHCEFYAKGEDNAFNGIARRLKESLGEYRDCVLES